jgi:excisionase family DNA binding protein
VSDVADANAPSQATPDATAQATTPQPATSWYATVREAADFLGVSTETVRRMIRSGRLRGEKVHRPQGTAFLVELPDATGAATRDVADGATVGRHHAAPDQALPPALLVAEAWARGVVEPLTRTIAEQQHQLVSQAEMIGRQSAELERAASIAVKLSDELDAARATISTLTASIASESAGPSPGPSQARWRLLWLLWAFWTAAAFVIALVVMLVVRW